MGCMKETHGEEKCPYCGFSLKEYQGRRSPRALPVYTILNGKYLIGKVSLIQSVGSVHLGEAIAKEAAKHGVCQDILLEVNIGREAAKSGLPPEELDEAIARLSEKKSLHIRGLMAIPPIADEFTKNLGYFNEMQQVFVDNLTKKYDNVDMDYLSMGMTNDFETAIACGANMVRIGTAIFGARPYQIVSP